MEKNKVERLRDLRVFRRVPASGLAPFLRDFVVRSFAPGERIWHQGDLVTCFTFLSSGHAKLLHTSRCGEETILGLCHPGDTLGHVTTHRSIPYPATAIAIAPVVALEIAQCRMFELIEAHPQLVRVILDDTTRRAHELVARIQELTFGTAEARLAFVFVRLVESFAHGRQPHGADPLGIPFVLTRRDLASLVCVREETAIRIMCRWQTSGIVDTRPDGFVVLDIARLRTLSAER